MENEDLSQQQELENIIRDLEEENSFLIEEYTRLQNQLNTNTSNKNLLQHKNGGGSGKASTLQYYSNKNKYQKQLIEMGGSNGQTNFGIRALSSSPTPQSSILGAGGSYSFYPASNGSLNNGSSMSTSAYNKVPLLFTTTSSVQQQDTFKSDKETQILAEARALRQHEDRLEARMKILENHNRLLDSQLKQLKSLLNNVSILTNEFSINSVQY
jgi:hypothetical protein